MPTKDTKKTTRKKGTSGNPARRAEQASEPQGYDPNDKYAPNTWMGGGQGQLIDLTCPSGQLCLAKKPGIEGLMAAGVLRNVDHLTGIVQRHLTNASPGAKHNVDIMGMMQDEEALAEILFTVDRVVCHVVVKPEISMTPSDATNRKPGVVYADMVDVMDKMFIFNFAVGGSAEVEPFRRGLEELVGSLEDEPGVPPSSE